MLNIVVRGDSEPIPYVFVCFASSRLFFVLFCFFVGVLFGLFNRLEPDLTAHGTFNVVDFEFIYKIVWYSSMYGMLGNASYAGNFQFE